jgi:putative tricarboxylic transport membrane protein
MSHSDGTDTSPTLARNRTMDMVVAALFIALSSVFMFDSWRIGVGWIEGQGPAAGFFPFWVCLLMLVASVVNLVRAAMGREADGEEPFVSTQAFKRVLLVLIPTALYVALIQLIGIYLASAIFIVGFMLFSGESTVRATLIGLSVPVALFLMFERWFLVPLPKGFLEAMLGIG